MSLLLLLILFALLVTAVVLLGVELLRAMDAVESELWVVLQFVELLTLVCLRFCCFLFLALLF